MSDCVRSTNVRQVKRPHGISLEISLLIDSEDISRLEPPVLGECPRSGLFVVEVPSRDALPLDPKLTGFSNATVGTIFTDDPSLRAGREYTDRAIDRFISRDAILLHRYGNREGLQEFAEM